MSAARVVAEAGPMPRPPADDVRRGCEPELLGSDTTRVQLTAGARRHHRPTEDLA